jgi:hypothetical protein
LNKPILDKLKALRDRLGSPLIVRSAYRSPEHNRAVPGRNPGKAHGQRRHRHRDGYNDPMTFEAAAREVGFFGFGF